jgi:hypothetical protein
MIREEPVVGIVDLLFPIASASKRCDLRGDERAMLAIASFIPHKVGRKPITCLAYLAEKSVLRPGGEEL